MTGFAELGLAAPLLQALAVENYVTPTSIQTQAIPHVMLGKDLLGIAQTGTGKTAAFALPILHRLAQDNHRPAARTCRVLVLAPTRELASQIQASFRTYGRGLPLTSTVVFGGVDGKAQARTMARGVDILVATPGRLVDHMDQGTIRLDATEIVVLDEVDRMLDIGFIHAIRRIVRHVPAKRQSLFFSATLPKDIAALAAELLKDPVQVRVVALATTADRVEQQVVHVAQPQKRAVLVELMRGEAVTRAIVFTRTKHRADQVARYLEAAGVEASAIHGNKSQNQRERALSGFRAGHVRVLVATDIAARGIDVDGVSHVINYDLPDVPESYVHRIGRTARAGAAGQAISFCDSSERGSLRDIEQLIRQRVPVLNVELSAETRAVERTIASAPPVPRAPEPAHRRPQAPRSYAGASARSPGNNAGNRGPRGRQPGQRAAY